MKYFNNFIIYIIIYIFTSCNVNKTKVYNSSENLTYDFHLYLNAKLNDSTNANLVFDTGANSFYLDSVFSKKIGKIGNISSFYVSGIGNKKQQISILNDSITLSYNGEKKEFVNVPIINLKKIIGSKIDGLLGNNFFFDKVVSIDYKSKQLKVLNNTNDLDLNTFNSYPFKKDVKNGIIINIKLSDNNFMFNGDYLIDTGSPQFITFTKKTSQEKKLDTIHNKKKYVSENYGIGGRSEGYSFTTKSILIDNVNIFNPVFDFSIDDAGSLSNEEYLGIVGNRFLENFVVVIDYKNNIVYLKQNNIEKGVLSDKYTLRFIGFSVIDYNYLKEGWLVTVLFDEGKEKGIELGDIILKVNNKSTKDLSYKANFFKLFNKNINSLEILRNDKIIKINYGKVKY